MLPIPSTSSGTILYINRGPLTLVVDDAAFVRRVGALEIGLPDRQIVGVSRDQQGNAVGGVFLAGVLKREPSGPQESQKSAVTNFKGQTNPDGTFEIPGLAPGIWSIVFNLPSVQPAIVQRVEVKLAASSKGATNVDVQLMPRAR